MYAYSLEAMGEIRDFFVGLFEELAFEIFLYSYRYKKGQIWGRKSPSFHSNCFELLKIKNLLYKAGRWVLRFVLLKIFHLYFKLQYVSIVIYGTMAKNSRLKLVWLCENNQTKNQTNRYNNNKKNTHKKLPKQQTQQACSHLSYNLTFYVLLLKNACSLQIVSLKTYVLSV